LASSSQRALTVPQKRTNKPKKYHLKFIQIKSVERARFVL